MQKQPAAGTKCSLETEGQQIYVRLSRQNQAYLNEARSNTDISQVQPMETQRFGFYKRIIRFNAHKKQLEILKDHIPSKFRYQSQKQAVHVEKSFLLKHIKRVIIPKKTNLQLKKSGAGKTATTPVSPIAKTTPSKPSSQCAPNPSKLNYLFLMEIDEEGLCEFFVHGQQEFSQLMNEIKHIFS